LKADPALSSVKAEQIAAIKAAYTRPRRLPPLKLCATFSQNAEMDFRKILIELRLRDHSVKLLTDSIAVPVQSTTSTVMLSAAFATLWVPFLLAARGSLI